MEQETTNTAGGNSVAPTRTLATSASFIAGAVLLILTLFIAGFYIMGAKNMDGGMMETTAELTVGSAEEIAATEAATIAATAALTTQSSSDELGSIEADLNATDLDVLGDIDQI